jgi:nucleotide-binding universal stress UspA family protein
MSNDFRPFQSILVPLDGSALAEQALPLAARIARLGGGKLRLAMVHEPTLVPADSPDPTAFAAAEAATRNAEDGYLRWVRTGLHESGTEVDAEVMLEGEIGGGLADYAHQSGVDLVVMATHGRGRARRVWLGSLADHLIRNLEVPLLLVREGQTMAPANTPEHATQLLVPLDGSPLAEEALGPAERLARIWGLELALLRVVPPVTLTGDAALPINSSYDEELTSAGRAEAQDYLDDLVAELRAQGLAASGAAVIGWKPVPAILDLAGGGRLALIAIATHGRGGLRRMALGSVADELVRRSAVPVLVYRPDPRGAAPRGELREPAAGAR